MTTAARSHDWQLMLAVSWSPAGAATWNISGIACASQNTADEL